MNFLIKIGETKVRMSKDNKLAKGTTHLEKYMDGSILQDGRPQHDHYSNRSLQSSTTCNMDEWERVEWSTMKLKKRLIDMSFNWTRKIININQVGLRNKWKMVEQGPFKSKNSKDRPSWFKLDGLIRLIVFLIFL